MKESTGKRGSKRENSVGEVHRPYTHVCACHMYPLWGTFIASTTFWACQYGVTGLKLNTLQHNSYCPAFLRNECSLHVEGTSHT